MYLTLSNETLEREFRNKRFLFYQHIVDTSRYGLIFYEDDMNREVATAIYDVTLNDDSPHLIKYWNPKSNDFVKKISEIQDTGKAIWKKLDNIFFRSFFDGYQVMNAVAVKMQENSKSENISNENNNS